MSVTSQPKSRGKGGTQDLGLEALERVDFLQIQQQLPIDIKAPCCHSGNTYTLKSSSNDVLFTAVEESNCCCRCCCGPQRKFKLTIFDEKDRPVLYLDRKACRYDWCCCFNCCCCQNAINVFDQHGQLLGSVRERYHIFHLKADVRDADEKVLHKLKGSCCPCRCSTDMPIDILNDKGNRETGYISKVKGEKTQWINAEHETMTVQFPEYINVHNKALLLGGAFLMEFMYFEMS